MPQSIVTSLIGMSGSILIYPVGDVDCPRYRQTENSNLHAFTAHVFSYYFSCMSYIITPPVCAACFTASRRCKATYSQIGRRELQKEGGPCAVLSFGHVHLLDAFGEQHPA